MSAVAIRTGQYKLPLQSIVIHWCRSQRLPLNRAQRLCSVIKMRYKDPALGILHTGKQLHEPHRRIRNPVPVVSTVERVAGPIDRDLHPPIPARAEDQALTPALV